MNVEFKDALVFKSGRGNSMLVNNRDGLFEVYWCDKIKHYKIKEIFKHAK